MLCVIAKLDVGATERLRGLQGAAAAFGLRPAPVYGHITLAAYTPEDDAEFAAGCRELLENTARFSVLIDRIEVLQATSIIAALPEKSGALLRLHDKIAARYGQFLDVWTRGGDWLPHVTLLYHPQAELPRVCRAMREGFSPFTAAVTGIEFSKVTETGYEITGRIAL